MCSSFRGEGGRIRLLFHSRQGMKIEVSIPSSRDRATVHRTVAFNCSNPALNTKSPTPDGVGLFVALLNLIYISIDAFENTKAKNILSRNGFRVLNYAQSGLFCVRTNLYRDDT